MDIEELLPDSYRKTADLATQFIIEHPEFITLLISELHKQKSVYAMRISRVLVLCHEQKPALTIPFTNTFLNILVNTKHNGLIRNMLNIFQSAWNNLDEDKLGRLLDFCFKCIENTKSEVALRVYSMNIILACTTTYPALKNELKNIIEFHYEESSAGFKACSRNILKQLNK